MIYLFNKEKKLVGDFESNDLLFEYFEKEGLIIEELEDGIIVCKKDKKKVDFTFGVLESKGTKDNFIEVLKVKKDEVKKAIDLMAEQGLKLTVEQKNILNDKYSVLTQTNK